MAYKNDPLIWQGGMKAGWASQMLNTMSKITDQMHMIEWPFIVLQGDADELTMCEGAIRLEEKAKSKDKTIKVRVIYYILCTCHNPNIAARLELSYSFTHFRSIYMYTGEIRNGFFKTRLDLH